MATLAPRMPARERVMAILESSEVRVNSMLPWR
jgi:hypothetical protein